MFSMVRNLDGSTSITQIFNRRCFNLGCQYVHAAPESVPLLECKGKCGILFCGEECRFDHMLQGHHLACPSIKRANERKSNNEVPASRVEKEEDLEVHLLHKVNQDIDRNMALPSVFYRGEALYRRFRSGQRVSCSTYGGSVLGTVIKTCFDPSFGQQHDCELFPYEIETDDGEYIHSPADNDVCVARALGNNIVSENIFIDRDLIPEVQAEIKSGYQSCIAARKLYGQSAQRGPPKLNRRRCAYCGSKHAQKLPVCTACESTVYCNRTCQKRHWSEHAETCKDVQKAKDLFLALNPQVAQKKQGRKDFRAAKVLVTRYSSMQNFLSHKCGLRREDGDQLLTVLEKAVDVSMKDDREGALCKLADEYADDEMADYMAINTFTSENLLRLLAGVKHFYVRDRELAICFVAGVDLFFQISFDRPLHTFPANYLESIVDSAPERMRYE